MGDIEDWPSTLFRGTRRHPRRAARVRPRRRASGAFQPAMRAHSLMTSSGINYMVTSQILHIPYNQPLQQNYTDLNIENLFI